MFVLLTVACAQRAPAVSATASFAEAPAVGAAGEYGAVLGSTRSGRFVVLWRWTEVPQFGQHGEPFPDAQTVVRDLVSGEDRPFAELVAVGGDRRYLLMLDGSGGYWLGSDATGAWEALGDADPDLDGNACLAPRGAAFAPNAARVSWIPAAADRLVVRDLTTNETWEVPGQGRVWRGWPDDEGRGATLVETSDERWPLQRTSCACRFCNAFAMSYGMYGWDGTFELVAVDGEGKRGAAGEEKEGARWHGPDERGCTLEGAGEVTRGVDRGPWRWVCDR